MSKTKSTTISLRLKLDELAYIEKQAFKEDMTRNAYILRRTLDNSSVPVSPELLCRFNTLKTLIAIPLEDMDKELKQSFKTEVNELCQFLLKL